VALLSEFSQDVAACFLTSVSAQQKGYSYFNHILVISVAAE